jgi:hypothetical protein
VEKRPPVDIEKGDVVAGAKGGVAPVFAVAVRGRVAKGDKLESENGLVAPAPVGEVA